MSGSLQPIILQQSADRCVELLQDLKKSAEKSRYWHTTTSTRNLLRKVHRDVNDSLLILQAWITQYNKGKQTTDDEIIDKVHQLFKSLVLHIDAADDALNARLLHRRIFLVGFIEKKKRKLERRLDGALENVKETIGKLNNQLKILLVDSSKQVDRQSRKEDVLEGTNQAHKVFSDFFNTHTIREEQHFRSSALNLLWNHIPTLDLENKIGNAEDPGDGLIYNNEQIAKATSILKMLYQAWVDAEDPLPSPAPERLPAMSKICLVLAGMKQQDMLEDFIDSNIVDEHLGNLQKNKVQAILKSHHIDCAATFVAEQYRAVPREWNEGDHVELEDEEPLPLVWEKNYNTGSFGIVDRVRDHFSQEPYALKKQIIANEEKQTAAARRHLEQETKRLKELNHYHVIQLVKSYQRGRAYGILLRPAATSNLVQLLSRYQSNRYNTAKKCRDRDWLGPILLTAFGCLSQGLAYIHGRKIRHKDVKPENILYEKEQPSINQGARFIWADFGLAYDFSVTGDSRTRSTNIYSKRYAAPEIVAANAAANNKRPYYERIANVSGNLDRIVENGENKSTEIELDSKTAENMFNSHGRKTDIFSLGCVFLELLGCLVDEKLPLVKLDTHEVPMFSKHIPDLKTWTQLLQESYGGRELAPLFKLAMDMISVYPDQRPGVVEVVKRVAALGHKYFCEVCRRELPAQDKSDPSPPARRFTRGPTSSVARSPTGTLPKRINSIISLKRFRSR